MPPARRLEISNLFCLRIDSLSEADTAGSIEGTAACRKPRGGERLSFAAIAERLDAAGLPTRTGKPWAPETVRGIVGRS